MRCIAVERASYEWDFHTYLSTSDGCGSCSGGKNAFDLKDTTTLNDGYSNTDPCLAPYCTDK